MAGPDLAAGDAPLVKSDSPTRHVLLVVGGFALLFAWLFAQPIVRHAYLADSDLYEYFLPQFLSPITIWSIFEFGGMPAFADPGEAVFYPLQLLGRLIGSWTALIIAVYLVSACGMYAYVYSLTRSRTAAALSGLAYGLSEAMMERLAHFGLLNTIAWFPLILLSVDRLRSQQSIRWAATGALLVASCFMAGNPQTFLYFGYVCAAYALIGGLAERASWRYYLSGMLMVAVAGLLVAVKALPMLEASLYTARQVVRFEAFAGHSNTPAQMLTIILPTIAHEGREAPTYVGLGTLLFATVALSRAHRNWRVMFWVVVAAIALLLGMGDTALGRLIFDLPMYDRFRIGARHLVFAALGLATLAGIGVAAIQRREVPMIVVIAAGVALLVGLVAGASALAAWPSAFEFDGRPGLPWTLPWWDGGAWSQIFIGAATAVAAVGFAARPRARAWTCALALLLAVDLVYALPYTMTPAGLDLPTLPVEATQPSVHAQRLAAAALPLHQRVLSPGGTQLDAVVPAQFARLWRIPIAGGYGPMLLARYGTLAMMGTNGSVDPLLLADHDAAGDLIAARFVTMHGEDFVAGETIERDGVTWTASPLALPVGPQECGQRYPRTARYALPMELNTTTLMLEAHLRCAESTPQGTPVALLKIIDESGGVHEQTLHAGVEIADEALKDPSVLRRAKHSPATIVDPSAERYTYVTRIDLPLPMRGPRLEILLTGIAGSLEIDRMTAIDGQGKQVPQTQAGAVMDRNRWAPAGRVNTSRVTDRRQDENVAGEQPYLFFENRRARPLAWLARDVIPLTTSEMDTAVHYSMLPDGRRFDAATMALVESGSAAAARHPQGASEVSVSSIDDGAIHLKVSSTGGGFLVVSEAYYPGWQARVDGAMVPVVITNGALQGVTVPPGPHLVTFDFISNTLRNGMWLSLAALGLVVVVMVLDRFLPRRHTETPRH